MLGPDEIVVSEGSEANFFYFIAEGNCQVSIEKIWAK
jgi:CRP-like cAMP-binding protein